MANKDTHKKFTAVTYYLKNPIDFLIKYGLFVIFFAMVLFFSLNTHYFFQFKNLKNILIAVSVIGVISTAMTAAIIGRGPDLTVGSIVAFSGCILANLVLMRGYPWYVGMAAAILMGLAVGFLNGLIIVKFELNSLIVTLGMMNVVRGLSFILVNGTAVFVNDYRLLYMGRASWLGIPLPIVIVIFSYIVFDFMLRNTVFGRQVFSSGGNRVAARLAGIDVNKNTIILFVLSGFMASIAGLITVGIGGAAMPYIGESYALDAVTAVLLGGTTLAGGKGSVRMTFLGVLIIGILNNGMTLMNVQTYWQITAKGAFLILAIILDSLQYQRKVSIL
ncbi:MAG: ABC transporter permease [Sphaerochaetaceae bacterium]